MRVKVGKGKTIAEVVKSGLCTGCGTCMGICPVDAIEMVIEHEKGIYIPQLDEEKCNQCGLCFEVCPGHAVDFKQLNLEIFGKEPNDILIGNYLNCYIGHATDYNIRYNSSSGGMVTALLIYALEERMIDGALVTRMKKDKPLEPEPFIARTKDEIIEAAKSKYCPVPANIALKEILKAKEGERFAVVGLPCHIHGIRKMELRDNKLRNKVAYRLGIFCGHTPTFLATQFLLWKAGVKPEMVSGIRYRGEGWPSGVAIDLNNGDRICYPHDYLWTNLLGAFFYPVRCTVCCDQGSVLADLSFGDAWLPETKDDNVGTSLVIARTELGQELLRRALSQAWVELRDTGIEKVKLAQGQFAFKKSMSIRAKFLRLLRQDVPSYNIELAPVKAGAKVVTSLFYLNVYISLRRRPWRLLSLYVRLWFFLTGLMRKICPR